MKKVHVLYWKNSEFVGVVRVYPIDQEQRANEDHDLLSQGGDSGDVEYTVDEVDFFDAENKGE